MDLIGIDDCKLMFFQGKIVGINVKINGSLGHQKDLHRLMPVGGNLIVTVFSFKYKHFKWKILIGDHHLMAEFHGITVVCFSYSILCVVTHLFHTLSQQFL